MNKLAVLQHAIDYIAELHKSGPMAAGAVAAAVAAAAAAAADEKDPGRPRSVMEVERLLA